MLPPQAAALLWMVALALPSVKHAARRNEVVQAVGRGSPWLASILRVIATASLPLR